MISYCGGRQVCGFSVVYFFKENFTSAVWFLFPCDGHNIYDYFRIKSVSEIILAENLNVRERTINDVHKKCEFRGTNRVNVCVCAIVNKGIVLLFV